MRVIAGTARGRRLKTVASRKVRPTADRVKEAIFSMIESRVDLAGTRVLDLFAGSGGLGIEALSRGAAMCTFVERDRGVGRILRENLAACGFVRSGEILVRSVAAALAELAERPERYDVVLVDAPYAQRSAVKILGDLESRDLLAAGCIVAVEHGRDEELTDVGRLRLTRTRRYGNTGVSLLTTLAREPAAAVTRKAVYAGSFDPITNGHLDIVRRALCSFDEIIVAVAFNASKDTALFSVDERVEMIREALADVADRVVVDAFDGLLVEYCERRGAGSVIRGLRAVTDFEYEFQMAMMNRHLNPRVETFFMTASEAYLYTASRLVKEVARLGGDVSGLIPPGVDRRLKAKFAAA
jgi:pantetheine-phosphate adenylyltransferase